MDKINPLIFLVNAVEHMNITHYRDYDLPTWHATYSTLMGALREVMREPCETLINKTEQSVKPTWFGSVVS